MEEETGMGGGGGEAITEGVGWPFTLPEGQRLHASPAGRKGVQGSKGSSLDAPHTSALPALELGGSRLLASTIQLLSYVSLSLGIPGRCR